MLGQEPAPRTRKLLDLFIPNQAHPSRIVDSIPTSEPVRETPRLVAIRETPREEDRAEGITGRAKVPSWDELCLVALLQPATPTASDIDPITIRLMTLTRILQ